MRDQEEGEESFVRLVHLAECLVWIALDIDVDTRSPICESVTRRCIKAIGAGLYYTRCAYRINVPLDSLVQGDRVVALGTEMFHVPQSVRTEGNQTAPIHTAYHC